jgi:hypothetical protein
VNLDPQTQLAFRMNATGIVPDRHSATSLMPGSSIGLSLSSDQTIERPMKLSVFLSSDAAIGWGDTLLDAIVIDPKVGAVSRSFDLPNFSHAIWQRSENNTAYIGLLAEPIGGTGRMQQLQAFSFDSPRLYEYDFIYDYDADSQNSDFYQGSVTSTENAYQLNQIIDPIADRNQSDHNGIYRITAIRPAIGTIGQTIGQIQINTYHDAETDTNYQPVEVTGNQGLGSESGYIRALASNTDRFGKDFYEADVWLTPPDAPQVGKARRSNDLRVRSLINPDGRYWDTQTNDGIITYSFYKEQQQPYAGREIVSELNNGVKGNVREIFANLEQLINVRFVEVEETATNQGAIRYLGSDGEGGPFYAYTYYPDDGIGGDVHLNQASAQDDRDGFSAAPSAYGYRTLLHETLHALGLKHPGNYDAGSGFSAPPYLSGPEDNSTNTIMSYNAIGANVITPMDYDRAALQYLYGARSARDTATIYQFSTLSSYEVDGEFKGRSEPVKQILWDTGGEDTLDFSQIASRSSNFFDLRPGGLITSQSAYNSQFYRGNSGNLEFTTSDYGLTLATGTLIENIVNSRANDKIIANEANNRFSGYQLGRRVGNDTIARSNQNDTLVLDNYRLQDIGVKVERNDLILSLVGDGTVRVVDYFSQPVPIQVDLAGQYYAYSLTNGWGISV